MKRLKKLSVVFLAVVVSAMLFVTGIGVSFATSAPTGTLVYDVDAAMPNNGKTVVTDNNGKSYTIDKANTVVIGSTVTLNTHVTHVRTPKGKVEAVVSHKYTFKELGYYTQIMGDYEGLRLECVSDNVSLKINDAEVPTYVKAGDEVTLPVAALVDINGKAVEKAVAEYYEIKASYVSPDDSTSKDAANNKFTTGATAGSYFVRYTATRFDKKVGEDGATAIYTVLKDYTVQTQKDFSDTEKPVLSATGVPNMANVRTAVTLPTASATDNFDEKVKIEISVAAPDGKPLKVYEEDGHLLKEVTGETVVLDNDKNMKFYPDQIGRYVVTYTATDDSGNVTDTRRLIDVKDGKAPVLVVEDENMIPAEWGLSVNNAVNAEVKTLTLPLTKAYDNQPFADTNYVIDATLQIRDPNGNYIYDPTASTPINKNDFVTEIRGADNALTGYSIDLSKADTGTGTYVVVYRAEDANKLSSTISKNITVTDNYSVSQVPKIDVSQVPDFLTVGKELSALSDFNISVSSDAANSSTSKAPNVSTKSTTVTYAGKTYSLSELADKGLMLLTAGDIVVTVQAQDALGNQAINANVTIPVMDFRNGTTPTTALPTSLTGDVADTGTLLTDYYDFLQAQSVDSNGVTKIKTGTSDVVKISGSKNVGFEAYVALKTSSSVANDTLSYVESTVTYIEEVNGDGTKNIYISSVKVAKDRLGSGTYTLVIRSFDEGVTGAVWTCPVEVKTGASGGDPGFETKNASVKYAANDGTVNAYSEKILLKRVPASGASLARMIKGTRYSIMGNYMVPMSASQTYTVESYPAATTAASEFKLVTEDSNGTRYPVTEKFTTQSDGGITFEVHDNYSSYYKLNAYVKVPDVSVISNYGAVKDYKVEVTSPSASGSSDGSKINSFYSDTDGSAYEEGVSTERYFKGTTNGVYVVTYTVNTETGSGTYSLNLTVGDIVKPELTIDSKPDATMKLGSKFKFSALSAEDAVTSGTDLKFTRTLLLPDGSQDDISDEGITTAGTAEATLSVEGDYTVIYTVEDKAGNKTTEKFTITVSRKASTGTATDTVTIVLIVVLVLLVIGLLVYFFAFRKIDFDKRKKNKNANKQSMQKRPAAEKVPKADAEDESEVVVDEADVQEEVVEENTSEEDATTDAETPADEAKSDEKPEEKE